MLLLLIPLLRAQQEISHRMIMSSSSTIWSFLLLLLIHLLRAQLEISHRMITFPPVRPQESSCQVLALRNTGDTPIRYKSCWLVHVTEVCIHCQVLWVLAIYL
jgi:hypothetical protein